MTNKIGCKHCGKMYDFNTYKINCPHCRGVNADDFKKESPNE